MAVEKPDREPLPPGRMSARRLLYWGDLDDTRRRTSSSGLSALPPWLYSAIAALVLGGVVARGVGLSGSGAAGSSALLSASNTWLAALAASHVVVLFGAPFRMFWRRDSAFVGRSAIAGRVLFTVALVRNVRAALRVAIPCMLSAVVFAAGPLGSLDLALRHLLLVCVAAVNAGLLGPAVALGAGAILASDRAQQALNSIAGEYQAPKTSWLGILPGLAGTGLALALIATAGWSRGSTTTPVGDPLYVLAPALALPILASFWAYTRANSAMLAAIREVAALDQERLAHVEPTGPSAIERLSGALLRNEGARLVHSKDASLTRRRYPIPFFLGVVGMVSLWILATVNPYDVVLWAAVVSGGLGVYSVIMARRTTSPPIEHPQLLSTLPISPRAIRAAKRMHVTEWVTVYILLGVIPVILRAHNTVMAAILLGAVASVTLVAGWVVGNTK
ncbi:MAG: hypothetical protein MJE77_21605 [Proteobacteria bacterium]|nr:hypothetical protein [Pseudomonadota bacterium]